MREKEVFDVREGIPRLRASLAAERTILANERTFLAFLRTALTLFAAAVTFIRFFDHPVLSVVGWIFIPVSIILVILGVLRYKIIKQSIEKVENTYHIAMDEE